MLRTKFKKLAVLQQRMYFSLENLADVMNVTRESARVMASRYTSEGIFIRLKRNLYLLGQSWDGMSQTDFMKISNIVQVPSYISLMTALSKYGVTTQVQRNYLESISLKRSVRFELNGTIFNYTKLQKKYYFGFTKENDIFIAEKEKAFVDAVYLYSFGKYKFDAASLDFDKLNMRRIRAMLEVFPEKTKQKAKEICRI